MDFFFFTIILLVGKDCSCIVFGGLANIEHGALCINGFWLKEGN